MIPTGPQLLRQETVLFTAEESRRVRAFIMRHRTQREARAALGLAESTFLAARDQGRVRAATRDKVMAMVDACI